MLGSDTTSNEKDLVTQQIALLTSIYREDVYDVSLDQGVSRFMTRRTRVTEEYKKEWCGR